MEIKEKLVDVFKKLIENATIDYLSREKKDIFVYDFDNKCKKKLISYNETIPKEIKCSIDFDKKPGYFIRTDESGNVKEKESIISIFPVKIVCATYFSNYKLKKGSSLFYTKTRKFKELKEIYLNHGLVGVHKYEPCDFVSYSWDGIEASVKTYVISYGQILRELTNDEYYELVNMYLDKLCELDLKFIESKIEENHEK
jgi:hypothetical protein